MNWLPIFAAGLLEGVLLGFVLAFALVWRYPLHADLRSSHRT
jgi:hypothetical protein